MNKKTIAIFGSTGSIGENTIKIIQANTDLFQVEILVANSNVEKIAKQALLVKPKYVCIIDSSKEEELKSLLLNTNIEVMSGTSSSLNLAKLKTDITVMAITGYNAILPIINAITTGNNIALANKECLVCAGAMIMDLAQKHQVKIIPVDSEHSGLFQIFDFKRPHLIKDVTLTASGGPFRQYNYKQMQSITKAQALTHPNWSMGAKITVDSASLVNKCLEVIEAYFLFPLKTDQIKIIIHPESIIHALVNYQDGSILTQLSIPNMQIPISYALFYPERFDNPEFNQFDLTKIGKLNFSAPDLQQFKSLELLKQVLTKIDSNAALVFNVANEVAVQYFLQEKIHFLEITNVIEEMLNKIPSENNNNIEDIIDHIDFVKQKASEYIEKSIS